MQHRQQHTWTPPRYNARSLEVNKVLFKADKELVKQMKLECSLTKGAESKLRKSRFTREERLQMLKDYLARPNSIGAHIKDYANLVGMSESTAGRELKAFAHDPASGITFVGRRASKVYILDVND